MTTATPVGDLNQFVHQIAANFRDDPPNRLQSLVEQCILRHVDQRKLEAIHVAEESERELLTKMAANVSNGDRPS